MLFCSFYAKNIEKILSENFKIKEPQTTIHITRVASVTFVQSEVTKFYNENGESFKIDDSIIPLSVNTQAPNHTQPAGSNPLQCSPASENKPFEITINKYERFAIDKGSPIKIENSCSETEFFLEESLPEFILAKVLSNNKKIGHIFLSKNNKTYRIIREVLRGAEFENILGCGDDVNWNFIKALEKLNRI